MLGGCSRCEKGTLSGFFEQRLKMCADCAAVMVDRATEFERIMPEMQKNLDEARKFSEALIQSHESEKLGMDAARKGLSQDQNPFSIGTEENSAWNFGWFRGELDRRTSQAIAVIEWAVLNLDVIEQLAVGYGQKEISDKLSVISEKLADFVEVK